jgi:hypothetical protein
MLPKLIDTKRVQRIMGIDMTPGSVTVDPEQSKAIEHTDTGVSINPNVGDYDVRVVVGASYSTQRSQAQEALSEVMRNNPALTPAIAPLWAQNLDIPHADKLAQVLAAMAPPAVQAILNPDTASQPKPEVLMQQNEQLKKGLQEAISHAHDAQAEADEAQEQLRDKKQENDIAQYNAETARLKVTGANEAQIQAIVQQLLTRDAVQPGAVVARRSRWRLSRRLGATARRRATAAAPRSRCPAATHRTRRVRVFLCLKHPRSLNLEETEVALPTGAQPRQASNRSRMPLHRPNRQQRARSLPRKARASSPPRRKRPRSSARSTACAVAWTTSRARSTNCVRLSRRRSSNRTPQGR